MLLTSKVQEIIIVYPNLSLKSEFVNMAGRPCRKTKKKLELQLILMKEEERKNIRQIRRILKKEKWDLTNEESTILLENPHVVQQVEERKEKHRNLCERIKEVIDPPEVLEEKCRTLADVLKSASSVVIYTGAGISTAANIPDYRGPEGVWTLLQKGKKVTIPDLSVAEPTFTHMAIRQLYNEGMITHIVSQNCDGLHLRSSLPRKALSEVHGNMFIEVCPSCKPLKQYIRLFDVTENTSLHRHFTGRFCKKCGKELKDTIVHFGERGRLQWPLNWKGAAKAASDADVILCLGSSLKVLKRYPCLWAPDKPANKKPKLYIVNLQWTPKDSHCTLKINGKCDTVMKHIASLLNLEVPVYTKEKDPIFQIATPLTLKEKNSTSRHEIPQFPICSDTFDKDILSSYNEHCYAKKEPEVPQINSDLIKYDIDATMDIPPDSVQSDFSVMVIKSEDEDPETVGKQTKLSGWYGKGCAKLRKAKRRKLL